MYTIAVYDTEDIFDPEAIPVELFNFDDRIDAEHFVSQLEPGTVFTILTDTTTSA